ncbi:IMS domain-containing protein [Leptolyngbya sp. AN10]|uniref:IMS domain-containing protein n=1 Tax=Leptolyngbya sp. AN10 TaxID=3423365 RepID=UPI003D31E6CC
MFTRQGLTVCVLVIPIFFTLGFVSVVSLRNPASSQSSSSGDNAPGSLESKSDRATTSIPTRIEPRNQDNKLDLKALPSPSENFQQDSDGFPHFTNPGENLSRSNSPQKESPEPNPALQSTTESINQDTAVALIQKWLQAKSQILDPTNNVEKLTQLTTGEVYLDSIEHKSQNDGVAQTNPESVGEVIGFTTSSQTAWLRVMIHSAHTQPYQFRIERDTDGTWKIAEIEPL